MLIQFNFKNFKSFKDSNTLDLSAVSQEKYINNSFKSGNRELLPICGIFGANASGKTNLIEAYKYMINYIKQSMTFIIDPTKLISGFYNYDYAAKPFKFDNESNDIPSEFEVYFNFNDKPNKIYNYGFSIKNTFIIEEWLNIKEENNEEFNTIFYRNNENEKLNEINLEKEYIELINRTFLRKEVLLLPKGVMLNIPIFSDINNFFANNKVTNADYITSTNTIETILHNINNSIFKDNLLKFINSFDSSIIDIKIDNLKSKGQNLVAVHKMIDSNEFSKLPVQEESAGTFKMLSLFPSFYDILQNSGVLFVDELNSKLHPLLVRHLLIMFANEKINKNHAQLIFSTHDAWQLHDNILRKDEIWFTEKDQNGISNLYSLDEFIDNSNNYEQNYLLGKYGAIPNLQNIEGLKYE